MLLDVNNIKYTSILALLSPHKDKHEVCVCAGKTVHQLFTLGDLNIRCIMWVLLFFMHVSAYLQELMYVPAGTCDCTDLCSFFFFSKCVNLHVFVWVKTAYGQCPPSCWEGNNVALCEPQLELWPFRITHKERHTHTNSDTFTHVCRYTSTVIQPASCPHWLLESHTEAGGERRWEWQSGPQTPLFFQAVREWLWFF